MQVICPGCKKNIQPLKVTAIPKVGATGGAIAGGYIGTHIGVALLGGAISGLLPVALVGAGIGYLALKNFRKCPECGHIFKV